MGRALVLGASGFLGSHIVGKLSAQGREVRALVRQTGNVKRIEALPIEIIRVGALDERAMQAAMKGCATVFHSVVDTRAWLRDPAPLYHTNVDTLATAMDAAAATGVERFVYASTIATIGRRPGGMADESDSFNWWNEAIDYVRSRVLAERMLLERCRAQGFPGVALCIANTYGPGDIQPTPQGRVVMAAASGALACYYDGAFPSVGIEDAADAMIFAERWGQIGERYIISESALPWRTLYETAARHAGRNTHFRRLPIGLVYAIAATAGGIARLRGRDSQLSVKSIAISRAIGPLDPGKARRELGWSPRPVVEAVCEAVEFYQQRGMIAAA